VAGAWPRERNATAKISAGFRSAVTLAHKLRPQTKAPRPVNEHPTMCSYGIPLPPNSSGVVQLEAADRPAELLSARVAKVIACFRLRER
jgi:hypothetical protein